MPRLLAGGRNHEHDTDHQSLTIERCYKNLFELNKNVTAWMSWMQDFYVIVGNTLQAFYGTVDISQNKIITEKHEMALWLRFWHKTSSVWI